MTQVPETMTGRFVKASQRDPAAPQLSVTLECPPNVHHGLTLTISIKVTYEAEASAKPITFHAMVFETHEVYALYRLQNRVWKMWDIGDMCGWRIVDDPEVPVKVGLDEQFTSLRPGESWITEQNLQGDSWSSLPKPDEMEDGETLRFVFMGNEVEWWDYGRKEDHVETLVKLPCYIYGPVVDPKDNDGRPKLVVPASMVEFPVGE
jgi:hypothetical protein